MDITKNIDNIKIRLLKGDCLEVMDKLADEGIKVDAVITDPPYGILNDDKRSGTIKDVEWDNLIDVQKMWERLAKVKRAAANVVLFGQDPFAYMLKNSQKRMYKYSIIWDKMYTGQGTYKDYQPLRQYEEIMVFYSTCKGRDEKYIKILEKIQERRRAKKITYNELNRVLGAADTGGGVACSVLSTNKLDTSIMNKSQLEAFYGIGIINDDEYKQIEELYAQRLSLGPFYNGQRDDGKYKNNIIQVPKISANALHTTQKPVELLEELLERYTKPGHTVLDFTMGSGSTGVACRNTGRNFIGIEITDKYFKIAVERITKENKQLKLF